MRQSAATGSFFGGVELEAATVKEGLMPRPVQPRTETNSGLFGRSFLEPQPPPDPALSDWGICMMLVSTDSGLLTVRRWVDLAGDRGA